MIELFESVTSVLGSNLDRLSPAFSLIAEAVPSKEVAEAMEPVSSESLLSLGGIFTLGMLILLQVVLGFDNLLYISIESKRVPEESQSKVRKLGIGLAIFFRIALLFVVIKLIALLQNAFLTIDTSFFHAAVSGHSLIVLLGGGFILYTALKEIYHLLSVTGIDHEGESGAGNSVSKAITMIVVMNLVFSFDSILSAMALTENIVIMATAIVFSGLMMIWLADHVAEFLKKNRMYEVLGLFVLFIVGVMLVSEGGHLADVQLLGHHVMPMAKSTFYFVLAVLIVVDVVQARFQKKLLAQQAAKESSAVS